METNETARPLDHMDRWSRNERLRDHLVAQGYWVESIYAAEEMGGIEWLKVALVQPRQQDQGN